MGNSCSSDCITPDTEQLDISVDPPRLEVGDEVMASGGKGFTNAQGFEIYRDGDKGKIRKFFKHETTGEARVKIVWSRTGMTTTFPVAKWQTRFMVIRKLSKIMADLAADQKEEAMDLDDRSKPSKLNSEITPAGTDLESTDDTVASEAVDDESRTTQPRKEFFMGVDEDFRPTSAAAEDIQSVAPLVTLDDAIADVTCVPADVVLLQDAKQVKDIRIVHGNVMELEAVEVEKDAAVDDMALYPRLLNGGVVGEAVTKALDIESEADVWQSLAAEEFRLAEASHSEAIAKECVDKLDDLLTTSPLDDAEKFCDIVDTSLWGMVERDRDIQLLALERPEDINMDKGTQVLPTTSMLEEEADCLEKPTNGCAELSADDKLERRSMDFEVQPLLVERNLLEETSFADFVKPPLSHSATLAASPTELNTEKILTDWQLMPSVGTWLMHRDVLTAAY